ncbi:MAG: transposase zinc-binding domain-containing protein [Proteobacteria bacterium]|nr:transposase zinc-binding domain-containing protein [Pseudomonadota bacterium]
MPHAAHGPLPAAATGYERRQPEQTLLYQTLAAHWPRFAQRCEEHGGLPAFVSREFEDYLTCGILEHGCVTVACRQCDLERLVGFSCKHRGFCPSCCGRRVNDTAAHLVDSVLPFDAPVRQWVCSLPWQLRSVLGYDSRLCSEVMTAFATELMRSYKRRAKQQLGLASVADAFTGTITLFMPSASSMAGTESSSSDCADTSPGHR